MITVPPRRRTVPFDDKPTIVDRYRPAPVAPDERTGARQRERFERDKTRVQPGDPVARPPVRRAPGDGVAPVTPTRPIVRPAEPRPAPRPGVTPRYRAPGRNAPAPSPVITRPIGTPGARLIERDRSITHRQRAPWTWGRSSREFHGRGPWGVNAAGRRHYGYWRSSYWSPYSFAWCHVPWWCRWGYYSWPAYYCTYWPRYYDYCSWGFGFNTWYWSYYTPYFPARHHLWYWPASVYAPTTIYYGADYGYDSDSGDASHVTIRIEGGEADIAASGDAVRVTREPAGAPPAASKETLAERHVTMADAYFRDGRYQEAVDSYLRALTYVEDDASIHLALADALFAQGDYHYSAFMINKALDLDPELAKLVVDKRKFYGDAATFDAQLATLRRYAAEKPYDAAAQLVLGCNLRFSGDDAGAELAFTRVLELQKDHPAATLFLSAIRAKPPGGDK